jgi:LacI family transcriptional regulator
VTPAHPTILDVAEIAGVSKSTVSNVVRGAHNVSPELRRRVLEAIAQLGYRPNIVARNLVRRRTSTVGLVVGDLANPFYSELAKLVEQRAAEAGYATIICNTDGRPASEEARVESLLEQRVAGIMMLQFSGDRSIVGEVLARGVPLVVVSCWEERTDCVAVDDREAAALGVRHLVELGHRRIAYLSSGLVEDATDRARFDGYARALGRAKLASDGLALRCERPAYLRSDPEFRTAVERLLARAEPPTAFFASNDLVAIDLIETLEELGRRVPADVAVVGFDDIAIAGLARVSLTTVAQPREELARLGTELLIRRVDAAEDLPVERVKLAATLVVRGSTAPPGAW